MSDPKVSEADRELASKLFTEGSWTERFGPTEEEVALALARSREAGVESGALAERERLAGENTRLLESVEHRRANAANIATLLQALIDGHAPMLRLLPRAISQTIDVCAKVARLDAEPPKGDPPAPPNTPTSSIRERGKGT